MFQVATYWTTRDIVIVVYLSTAALMCPRPLWGLTVVFPEIFRTMNK